MKKALDWEPLEIRRNAMTATLFHQALAGHLIILMQNVLYPVQRSQESKL